LDDLFLDDVDRLGTYVGVFIARISKGRTIREFILGVMNAPRIISMI